MHKKILVVDDEADTLKLLALRLKKNGYDVITCETGKQALEAAQKEKIHLAILDIKLPDMTGYDILKELRGYPGLQTIPVIFSTADASVAVKKTAKEYTANAFVIKPYDAQDLLKKIELLLKAAQSGEHGALLI